MQTKNHPHKQLHKLQRQVALHDLRFYAYHGLYPEEQVLGNEFFVDVSLSFDHQAPRIDGRVDPDADFSHTVNYEVLYQLVKDEMEMPRKLLETACYKIFDRISSKFPFVDSISVRIRKSNPPFGGDSATAVVALNWNR